MPQVGKVHLIYITDEVCPDWQKCRFGYAHVSDQADSFLNTSVEHKLPLKGRLMFGMGIGKDNPLMGNLFLMWAKWNIIDVPELVGDLKGFDFKYFVQDFDTPDKLKELVNVAEKFWNKAYYYIGRESKGEAHDNRLHVDGKRWFEWDKTTWFKPVKDPKNPVEFQDLVKVHSCTEQYVWHWSNLKEFAQKCLDNKLTVRHKLVLGISWNDYKASLVGTK